MFSTWYCARLLALFLCCVISQAVHSTDLMRKNSLTLRQGEGSLSSGKHSSSLFREDKDDDDKKEKETNKSDDSKGIEDNGKKEGDDKKETADNDSNGKDDEDGKDGKDEKEEDDDNEKNDEDSNAEKMPSAIYSEIMEECSSMSEKGQNNETKDDENDDGDDDDDGDDKKKGLSPEEEKEAGKQKKQAMEEAKSKKACKPQAEMPLSSMFKEFYQIHGEKVVSGKTTITLAHHRPAELTGWTNVKEINKGFVKTDSGDATATVQKLKAGEEYSYAIYQYDNTIPKSNAIVTTVSVNGGKAVTTESNSDEKPAASGKVKAGSSGSIVFKFSRQAAPECSVKGPRSCDSGKPEPHTFDGKSYCCPSSGPRFRTLSYPAVVCPKGTIAVGDASSCRELAQRGGMTWKGVLTNDANWIDGCFEWKGARQGTHKFVYYNNRRGATTGTIGGHRLCRVSEFKVISRGSKYCGDNYLRNERSPSLADCQNKCDNDNRCRYASFWNHKHFCRTSASCDRQKETSRQSRQYIYISKKTDTEGGLVLSGISIANSCSDKSMSFRQMSEITAETFTYDPFEADLEKYGDGPPDEKLMRFQGNKDGTETEWNLFSAIRKAANAKKAAAAKRKRAAAAAAKKRKAAAARKRQKAAAAARRRAAASKKDNDGDDDNDGNKSDDNKDNDDNKKVDDDGNDDKDQNDNDDKKDDKEEDGKEEDDKEEDDKEDENADNKDDGEDEDEDEDGDSTTAAPEEDQEANDHEGSDEKDPVKTPDLRKREYELPEVTNDTAANTLVRNIVEGADAEKNVPDLKQLDAAGGKEVATDILRTIHHVDVQTKLVYDHWLTKTCREVKEADTLQSKKTKAMKLIKQLSKVCSKSIAALKKQNMTMEHPQPKPLGEGKAGFETVNPSERDRQYSYYSHASSMLDTVARNTIYSNRVGESVVIRLPTAKQVRGIVTQGQQSTSSYMYTYNVQWQDTAGKWHTMSDGKVQDTRNWNSGQYSKRCKDTPNWRARRYGWNRGRRSIYTCSYFQSRRYCVRRNAPQKGYIRYWWIGRYRGYGYPQRHCCACGKAPERRTCADYVSNGWCRNGHVRFQRNSNHLRIFGRSHRYPMSHCAACGKGAKAFKGGQYNRKVTQLFASPVMAKAIRIITKTGTPTFRAGLIIGKSEVEVKLAGTPWVGSVNFDFPHHPYKILTSQDGRSWKLAASGISAPTHFFNPPLHTSYVKLDYQEEGCHMFGGRPLTDEKIKAMGFKLVRRNGRVNGRLHPARDRLVGSQIYGSPCTGVTAGTCNRDFSLKWNQEAYDEFLFTTGDMKYWLQAKKSQVLGHYANTPRTVLCSSDSKTPHSVRWYRRTTAYEDPWISLKDHHGAEREARVRSNLRASECARGGGAAYTHDDNDGQSYPGPRRRLNVGTSHTSHTRSYLNSPQGWASCEKTRGHWLQLDLGRVQDVAGVVTQPPQNTPNGWVSSFKVRYADSSSSNSWQWAKPRQGGSLFRVRAAGRARNTKTKNYFSDGVKARYVRIYPKTWAAGFASMRADVLLGTGGPGFLYGENSVRDPAKTALSRAHLGLNVYIRMSPKSSQTPSLIPVKYSGYTADPGKLIYPDSKVRLDACGDATKKKENKDTTVEKLEKVSVLLDTQRKDIAESVEFLNKIKSIRSRIDTFEADYNVTYNDTLDWSNVLLKANLSLTTQPSTTDDNATTGSPLEDASDDDDDDDDDGEKEDEDDDSSSKDEDGSKSDDDKNDDGKDDDDDDDDDDDKGSDKQTTTSSSNADEDKNKESRFASKRFRLRSGSLNFDREQEMF